MADFTAGAQVIVSTAAKPFTELTTGQPADPTGIQLLAQVNGGVPTQYPDYGDGGSPLSKVSPGVYQATLDTTAQPGTWLVQIVGTGACAAIAAVTFTVAPPPINPGGSLPPAEPGALSILAPIDPAAGDLLVWNGSAWVADTPSVALASPGGTADFLRADGAWAAPPTLTSTPVYSQTQLILTATPTQQSPAGKWQVAATEAQPLPQGVSNNGDAGPALNDSITWGVALASGTYTLDFYGEAYSDSGTVQWSLDGTDVGSPIDLYTGSGPTTSRYSVIDIVVAATGGHLLSLTVTGKNASSSGYIARLAPLATLTRTA